MNPHYEKIMTKDQKQTFLRFSTILNCKHDKQRKMIFFHLNQSIWRKSDSTKRAAISQWSSMLASVSCEGCVLIP